MDSYRSYSNEIETTLRIEEEISKIPSSLNSSLEMNSSRRKKLSPLPELKKKIREKKTVPHYPNKYTKMSSEEIEEFKKKHKAEKIIISLPSIANEKMSLREIEFTKIEGSEENRSIEDLNQIIPEIPSQYYIDSKNKTDKFFYKKVGECNFFFGDDDGNPLFIIGNQWQTFLFLSLLFDTVIVIFIYILYSNNKTIQYTIGIIILSIFQLSFTLLFILNPGYPKNNQGRQYGEPRPKYKMCNKCGFWVEIDKNVNHCYECNICIEGYDHHCSVICKCIGRRNKYWFYVFMFSTILLLVYFIISIFILVK